MTPANPDMIAELHTIIVRSTTDSMKTCGLVLPPSLHMFCEHDDHPYSGWIATRPRNTGADAYNALAALGWAPAALNATRILMHWEEADLQSSLYGTGNYSPGIAILDATLRTHTITWRPRHIKTPGGNDESNAVGDNITEPHWGTPELIDQAALPEPVITALTLWRAHVTHISSPHHTMTQLSRDGYRIQIPPPA